MNLDTKTRAKITHSNNMDDNFDHLKIECRSKDKTNQHEDFGAQLLEEMKQVKKNKFLSNQKLSYLSFKAFI